MKNLIFVLLLIIVLAGVAFGAYYAGTSKIINIPFLMPSPTPTSTVAENMVGNDRDEHGCIPSAGYTWCEEKQKCLRIWEEPCLQTPSVNPTTNTTVAPTIDETENLKTIIKQLLIAKHGSTAESLNITVSKIIGNYAQGGAGGTGGGGMWFAAKVNNEWKIVWDGNGTINCSDIAPYPNLPTTMIPECYDPATQKSIIR